MKTKTSICFNKCL